MPRKTVLANLAVIALLSTNAAYSDGDPEKGKEKAETCLGCHGIAGYTNAYPTYRVPKIGGQHAARILAALEAYKSGERNHATMRAQASSLSREDMEDIAAYLASVTK